MVNNWHVIWLLGIEFIIYCIIILFCIKWSKILSNYLKKYHNEFYKAYLDVPFLAGGYDVMQKHYKAFKIAYWGHMPDELSNIYQRKMKFYFEMSLFCLAIIIITMISVIIIKQLMK